MVFLKQFGFDLRQIRNAYSKILPQKKNTIGYQVLVSV